MGEALRLIAKGFTIFGRTEVNKYIGKGQFKNAKSIFFNILLILTILAVIIHALLYFLFSYFSSMGVKIVHPDI